MNWKRLVLLLPLGLVAICLLLVGISFLSNLGLPTHSQVVDRLSEQDKARLLEAAHLRESLGETIWPGWQDQAIPVITYNESYAFLIGLPDPPEGWLKVPQKLERGGPWELVPEDRIGGQPYYRQRLTDPELTPENFTVLVGDRWVASLQTKEFMLISFVDGLNSELPPVVRSIVPYRLAWRLLVNGSDGYISVLLHEQFHAFQGIHAGNRLASAERAVQQEGQYPWDNSASEQSWKEELELLYQAATAGTEAETADLARQFLDWRDQRRVSTGLGPDLIGFEQEREWLEGLAKYVELESGPAALRTPAYQPLAVMGIDSDFDSYSGRVKFREAQLAEVKRMTNNDGEVRFYYTGMAQAVVLDRLMSDWKSQAFGQNVYLEDILRQALDQPELNTQ